MNGSLELQRPKHSVRAILTVLLLSAAACAESPRGETRAAPDERVVPWIEAAPPPPIPTPAAVPPAAPCTAAHLTVSSLQPGGAAAGTSYAEALLRNTSSNPCVLTPDVTITFLDAEGQTVQPPDQVGLFSEGFIVVPPEDDLRRGTPGAFRASLLLGISSVCPPPVAASGMELTLPEGDGIVVEIPDFLSALPPVTDDCSPAPYVAFFQSEMPPPPDPPLSPLRAKIIAPDTARLGERFRFLVRLANPTEEDFRLEPCPLYSEGFKGEAESLRTYQLNCSDVKSIPADSSVTYEMFLPIPSNVSEPAGVALLTWGFDYNDRYLGPSVSTTIELKN